MQYTIGVLSPEDHARWRKVCALVEVAQSPPQDMTVEQAQKAWVDYYALTSELYEKYGVEEEDMEHTSIPPASGRIVYEDD